MSATQVTLCHIHETTDANGKRTLSGSVAGIAFVAYPLSTSDGSAAWRLTIQDSAQRIANRGINPPAAARRIKARGAANG